MMPIEIIRKKVLESKQPDIESIGALLEHHGYSIIISNAFSSDCGDKWKCKIANFDKGGNYIKEELAPSLRTAILNALEEIIRIRFVERDENER